MDLCRQILLAIEAVPAGRGIDSPLPLSGEHTESVITETVKILADAGFIAAGFRDAHGRRPGYSIYRLTWEGHDALDLIRDDERWEHIRALSNQSGLSALEAARLCG